jgi:hypothetical protein
VIVECIYSRGDELGENERGHFYSKSTVFDVQVGGTCVALGMGIFETILLLLISDDTSRPNWLPIGLFDLQSSALPCGAEFKLRIPGGPAHCGTDLPALISEVRLRPHQAGPCRTAGAPQ